MKGTIIKGIAGFYYIKTENDIVECKARGKFRFNELTPMVGDEVEVTVKNNKGVIEKIFDRKSELIRPAVSNVTQAYVVFTLKNPDLNLDLLNKFLIQCEYHHLKATVCFNKMDLVSEDEISEVVKMIESAGYTVLFLEAKKAMGLEKIKEGLEGNVSVFCGPSGVGKSTILNNIIGNEVMETGSISEKVGRGKHTTRHSQLIEVNHGFVVDTPGFSSLDIQFISREDLQNCFPEFKPFMHQCKFSSCLHHKEPGCAVKEAVSEKEIHEERYNFYTKTLDQLTNRRNTK